jgi:hypothetical protein
LKVNCRPSFNEAPDALIVINEEAILSDGTQKPNKFWMVIDRGLGKSIVELIMPEKYKENIAVGFKNFLKTGEATIINKTMEITALNKKILSLILN